MSKTRLNPEWWKFPADNPQYQRRFVIALRIAGWPFHELYPSCRAALKLLLENLIVLAEANDREKAKALDLLLEDEANECQKALDLLLKDKRNDRLKRAFADVKSGPGKRGRPVNPLNRALALMLTIAYQDLTGSDLKSRPARLGLEAGAKAVFQILRLEKNYEERREETYVGHWKSAIASAVKILKE